jgi:CHAT domain-containing protein/Tfp pilus assembly protein PilF
MPTALLLLLALAAPSGPGDELRVGEPLHGRLAGELRVPLAVEADGPVTLVLRSYEFDALLEVQDERGATLASNDDGPLGTHSLLVLDGDELRAARTVIVDALHGETGTFELVAHAGVLEPLDEAEEARLAIESLERAHDAVRLVDALGAAAEIYESTEHFGTALLLRERALEQAESDGAGVATALVGLASVHGATGRLDDAGPLTQRAIELLDGTESPTSAAEATTLVELGRLLLVLDRADEALDRFHSAIALREAHAEPVEPRLADLLGRIGGLLYRTGHALDARPFLERGRALFGPDPDRDRSAADVTCTEDLILVLLHVGEYQPAAELAEEQLEWTVRARGADDVDAIWLHSILGDLLGDLDRLEESERHYRIAWRWIHDNMPVGASPRVTMSNNLAQLLITRGKWDEAEQLYLNSLEECAGDDDVSREQRANVLNGYGCALDEIGRTEEARTLLERAVELHRGRDEPDLEALASCYGNLGSILFELGDYRSAEDADREALRLKSLVFGERHPETASILKSLGLSVMNQGRTAEARQLFEDALEIATETRGPDSRLVASVLKSLGSVHYRTGSLAEAEHHYSQGAALYEDILGPDHPGVALDQLHLAWVYEAQGRTTEAIAAYRRALAVARATRDPANPLISSLEDGLGSLLAVIGELDEASELLTSALEKREALEGDDDSVTWATRQALASVAVQRGELELAHARYREIAEWAITQDIATNPGVGGLLSRCAQFLFEHGDREEAWRLAKLCLEARQSILEAQRWGFSEVEQMNAVDDALATLELALSLQPATPEDTVWTYAALLRWKGNTFRSTVRGAATDWSAATPEARELLAEIQAVQASISSTAYRRSLDDAEQHAVELTELRARRGRLERSLQQLLGERLDARAPDLDTLRASLPPSSALVDFFVVEPFAPTGHGSESAGLEWGEPRLLAWVVGRGAQPARFDLGPAAELEGLLRAYLEALADTPLGLSGAGRVTEAGEQLRRAIWDPLAASLGDVETVFVVPDRFVGAVAFASLPGPDGSYLVESKRFVQLQGAFELARDEAASPASDEPVRALIAGGLNYEAGALDPDAYVAPVAAVRVALPFAWPRLRYSLQEVETLAALLAEHAPDSIAPELLLAQHGTESRIKALAPGAAIVHLSTHGFFADDDIDQVLARLRTGVDRAAAVTDEDHRTVRLMPGLLSGLACSGANESSGQEDGLLTAEEVSWLDLRGCELVTLSACSTGLGVERSGEGMLGLRRSFRMAGAEAVVASLWAVDDEATSELMVEFYRRWLVDGRSRADALREAQLEMLRRCRERFRGDGAPFYWAAFVLDGDWR